MEKGIYDKAADEIVRRYGLVKAEIVRRNKGKKPFRMEPMSEADQVAQYLNMAPEVLEKLRTNDGWNEHELKIREIMARRSQDAR